MGGGRRRENFRAQKGHLLHYGAVFTKKFELIFLMTWWFGVPPRLNRAPSADGSRKPRPASPFYLFFSYPAAERYFPRLGDAVEKNAKQK